MAAPPSSGAGGLGGSGAGGSSGITDPIAGGAPPALDAGGDTEGEGMTPSDGGADASDGDAMVNDGAMPEPQPPRPGQAYGPCRADGSCDAPLLCGLATLGGTETYCTMFCSVSGFGGQPCPAQPSGNPGACVSNVCAR